MTKRLGYGLAGIGLWSLLAGCGGGLKTTEDVIRKVFPVYCSKLKECIPDGFNRAYPNGVDQCVQKALDATPAADKSKNTNCSSSKVDTCLNDIKAASCAAVRADPSGAPTSCNGC